jgi:FkbM family methyltransferase
MQLRELLSILSRPSAWRALATWKPFSITAFKMIRALEMLVPEIQTIIDVGANEGQFSRAASERYPGATIVAFEPLPDVGEKLRQNLSDLSTVRIDRRAVGAANGRLSFNRYDYTLQSSPLSRLPEVPEHPSDNQTAETIDVPVVRLDAALSPNDLQAPSLLKIDVQGYELKVLDGARELLPAIDYILVEAAFKPWYEDQPLFADIYSYLTDRGFQLRAPVDVLRNPAGVVTQIDVLFQRK